MSKLKYEETFENIQELRDELDRQLCEFDFIEVTFTKKNGDFREMTITKWPELIPQNPVDPDKPVSEPKKQNSEVYICYSIGDSAWRSFRLDGLISIQLPCINVILKQEQS